MPALYSARQRIVVAYVIFEDSHRWRWWFRFVAKGWRHVWLAIPAPWPAPGLLATNFTIKAEPLSWGVDHQLFYAEPEDVARGFVDAGATCAVRVTLTLPPTRDDVVIYRGVYTCVAAVKAAMGLRCWWVWTPRQLCRYLLAHCGAHLMVKGDDLDETDWRDLRGCETAGAGRQPSRGATVAGKAAG